MIILLHAYFSAFPMLKIIPHKNSSGNFYQVHLIPRMSWSKYKYLVLNINGATLSKHCSSILVMRMAMGQNSQMLCRFVVAPAMRMIKTVPPCTWLLILPSIFMNSLPPTKQIYYESLLKSHLKGGYHSKIKNLQFCWYTLNFCVTLLEIISLFSIKNFFKFSPHYVIIGRHIGFYKCFWRRV